MADEPEMTLAEFGDLLSNRINDLIDAHAAAARANDVQHEQAARAEIIEAISTLCIGAAARGRTMTADEAKMVFGAQGGLH